MASDPIELKGPSDGKNLSIDATFPRRAGPETFARPIRRQLAEATSFWLAFSALEKRVHLKACAQSRLKLRRLRRDFPCA